MSILKQNLYMFILKQKPGLLYIYYSSPGKTKAHIEDKGQIISIRKPPQPKLSYNARRVYRDKFFVGYYNIYIVTNKNLYVFIQNKICICLYRNKNDTNYVYFIVGVKNYVYLYRKQKQKLYVYTEIKQKIVCLYMLQLFFKKEACAHCKQKEKEPLTISGKRFFFFFFRKKYPNQFYSIVRMRVKIYFPQKFGRNFQSEQI